MADKSMVRSFLPHSYFTGAAWNIRYPTECHLKIYFRKISFVRYIFSITLCFKLMHRACYCRMGYCNIWVEWISIIAAVALQPTVARSAPGVGVTKSPFVNISVSKIFNLAKVPVILFASHSYLTGVTAAELRQHLSNMNMIFKRQLVFWQWWKIGKSTERRKLV